MNAQHPTDPVATADNWRMAATWIGTVAGALTPRTWGEFSAMLACLLTAWILGERGWKRYKRWRAGLPVVPIEQDTGKGDL